MCGLLKYISSLESTALIVSPCGQFSHREIQGLWQKYLIGLGVLYLQFYTFL